MALAMVTLYPSNPPSSLYAIASDDYAEFPVSFSQFTISLWCYKQVTLQWPDDAHSPGQPYGLLRIAPDHVTAAFRDSADNLLFSGTFANPGSANTGFYNICFSIDTQAQQVVCAGNSVLWPSYDRSFAIPGDISNIPEYGIGNWEFIAGSSSDSAGIGQVWLDPTFADFSDPTVLPAFVNSDGSWKYLGVYGELPFSSDEPPNVYLVAPDGQPANSILHNYSMQTQMSWDNICIGNDPTTGKPYPTSMAFVNQSPSPSPSPTPPPASYIIIMA